MMNKLYIVGAIVYAIMMISLGSFFIGMQHQQLKQEREQVKVLHGDAKKSIELEGQHEVRKTQTREIVKIIHADSSDCANSRSSDAFLTGMRAKGVSARSPSSP